MKKSNKKWMMGIISLVFVALMMVNVSVSIDDTGSTTDICLDGITTMAVAQGTEDPGGGGCSAIACLSESPCGGFGSCSWREVCNGCSCSFQQVASFTGSGRCGG